MVSNLASKILLAAVIALGAAAFSSCGSVSPSPDGGGGGTTGAAGTSGGGTTGAAGTIGSGGAGGMLTCRMDMSDCPAGFTCACGGPGPGVCTCHRNCTDTNQCPAAEPMCGCPGTTGAARYCVNACFCNCN
jgi:hypothetical protein